MNVAHEILVGLFPHSEASGRLKLIFLMGFPLGTICQEVYSVFVCSYFYSWVLLQRRRIKISRYLGTQWANPEANGQSMVCSVIKDIMIFHLHVLMRTRSPTEAKEECHARFLFNSVECHLPSSLKRAILRISIKTKRLIHSKARRGLTGHCIL